MSVVIEGGSANTSFIYVCGVRMPALYRARIANVRVANGRQIVVEPILPGGAPSYSRQITSTLKSMTSL